MAYATIANGGFLMRPYLVRRVVGPKGEVLLETSPRGPARGLGEDNALVVGHAERSDQ